MVLNDHVPSNLAFLFEDCGVKCLTSESVAEVSFDLAVAIDCGEKKLFEDRIGLFERAVKTASIDHHPTNTRFAEVNWIDSEAAATGELIFDLCEAFSCPLTPAIGEALYTAIVTDTGSFRYSNTRPKTFDIAKTLMKTDFDFNRVNVALFQNKSLEKLRLLNRVFDTLQLHFSNRVAVVTLSQEMMASLALSEYDTDGIVEFVRDISGVEVVVFIRYIGNGAHKVSMRAKYDFDLSVVASRFHGGGHKKAAGFKSDWPIEQIEKALLEALGEAFHDV
jgi:phosphoesterase RecJ-like protein